MSKSFHIHDPALPFSACSSRKCSLEIPEEATIPLPPSPGRSEHGEEEAMIPLPPSIGGSQFGEEDGHVDIEEGPPEIDVKPLDPPGPEGFGEEDTTAEIMVEQESKTVPCGEIPHHQGDPFGLPAQASAPLSELMDMIQKDKWELRQCLELESAVCHSLGTYCLQKRAIPLQRHLYRRMLDCFRMDSKSAFAAFYSQSFDIRSSCYVANSPIRPLDSNPNDRPYAVFDVFSKNSWLSRLSQESQTCVLRFLNDIRTNNSFLADRIAQLHPSQLAQLARPYRSLTANASAFPTRPVHGTPSTRSLLSLDARGDKVYAANLQRDPLFLLLHGVFDCPPGSPDRESDLRLDIWSSVCAKLIAGGKPGSHELCLVVLDNFADVDPWSLRTQLEVLLMEFLQTAPSLDGQTDQGVEFFHQAASQITETIFPFYDMAIEKLLTLLTTNNQLHAVPMSCLKLIHFTLQKIEDVGKRQRTKDFFISHWYCASFLTNSLVFPEVHGIMLSCHIEGAIRQKIFREIAVRLQKHVHEVLCPGFSATIASPAIKASIKLLQQLFDPSAPVQTSPAQENRRSHNGWECIMIEAHDIISLSNTLYPETAATPAQSYMVGKASSIASGFTTSSTFTASTNDLRTGTASSMAPSLSGTSITSNTLSNNNLNTDDDKTYFMQSAFGGKYFSHSHGLPDEIQEQANRYLFTELRDLFAEQNMREDNTSIDHNQTLFFVEASSGRLASSPENIFDEKSRCLPLHRGQDSSSDGTSTKGIDDQFILREGISELVEQCVSHQSSCLFDGDVSVTVLEETARLMIAEAQMNFDFRSAHKWWRLANALSSLSPRAIQSFVVDMLQDIRDKFCDNSHRNRAYQNWLSNVEKRKTLQEKRLRHLSGACTGLRDKMWYVTDVRHSSIYEEAQQVCRALRTMAKGPAPKPTGMAAWARRRLRSASGHERAQTQTFEALSAPSHHGGPSKLKDEQADLISRWLTQESIENFCQCEERIHRFCHEIQRCASKLVGGSLLSSPVLWSSSLVQPEKTDLDAARKQFVTRPSTASFGLGRHSFSPIVGHPQASLSASHQNYSPFVPPMSSTYDINNPSNALLISHVQSLPKTGFDAHNLSILDPPISFPKPNTPATPPQNWTLPPSPVSPGIADLQQETPSNQPSFVQDLRITTISLLLSDLGNSMWKGGSETDKWVSDESVQRGSQRHDEEDGTDKSLSPLGKIEDTSRLSSFPSKHFYRKLLTKFRFSTDPRLKLQTLYELAVLVASTAQDSVNAASELAALSGHRLGQPMSPGIRGVGVPRTRLTRLQEVTANCEERRLASMASSASSRRARSKSLSRFPTAEVNFSNPAVIDAIQSIFLDPALRPDNFFRDLQFIAAFTPTSILDRTPQGTAFWTVGLAAMSLKSDLCSSMTARATQALSYHLGNGSRREPVRAEQIMEDKSTPQHPPMSGAAFSQTTLADAARLYTLSALEGDPTAARELALFYLTHPELVPRVILPLSKPSEVFKPATTSATVEKSTEGDARLHPLTFATALHWMEFAADAGDTDARTFLRENGDLGGSF